MYGIHKQASCNPLTLSLHTWEGPMTPVSPGAPMSLVRPCFRQRLTFKTRIEKEDCSPDIGQSFKSYEQHISN